MKAHLLYPHRDLDPAGSLPAHADALIADLGLDTVFEAMARGDEFLHGIAKTTMLASLDDAGQILYRQDILRDCVMHPDVVRQIYDLAVEAIHREHKVWGVLARFPESTLHHAIEVLELFVEMLKRLRGIAHEHAADFRSEGFATFFTMIVTELDDDYFQVVSDHLKQMRFRDGVLISARLGKGGKGRDYTLRKRNKVKQSWLERLTGGDRSSFSFTIPDRDDGGFRALSDLQGRGINLVANALARSTDHILSFFHMLRAELGFYVACLNLHDTLTGKAEPFCFPTTLVGPGEPMLSFTGLYDTSLSLNIEPRVVGNDVNADGKSLIVITGANEGGKSTFLRSVGLAQLMMHSGMFVPAESYASSVCAGLVTHFRREEDETMSSGKLDEELARMSEIADHIRPTYVLLCNESFAATNEREGSQIAREIFRALLEGGVKVFVVTHMFDLADGFYRQHLDGALFLRAEREFDGRRTFRLSEGEPLRTSFGEDVYEQVFAATEDAAPADPAAVGHQ